MTVPPWYGALPVAMTEEKYEITEVREFHLDAVVSEYRLHRVHRDRLELELPLRVAVPLETWSRHEGPAGALEAPAGITGATAR
ncbi:hypothetical protein ACIBEJ_09430 [Nonomuraea sp. NPDC050790]|uniref:hypothetical protein n=1 Tax=Nonomuraea sp. NPDC050790 TaxID=3364371 RepID=UPI0037A23E35